MTDWAVFLNDKWELVLLSWGISDWNIFNSDSRM